MTYQINLVTLSEVAPGEWTNNVVRTVTVEGAHVLDAMVAAGEHITDAEASSVFVEMPGL